MSPYAIPVYIAILCVERISCWCYAARFRWSDIYADMFTGSMLTAKVAPLFDDSGTVLLGVSYGSQMRV